MTIPNTTDHSNNAPALAHFLNTGTLLDLPKPCALSGKSLEQQYKSIKTAGFTGLQDGDAEIARKLGLQRAGSGRINHRSDVEPLVEEHLKQDYVATTLHVGWGTESDSEVDALLSKIISVADTYRYPLYIETHRATVTQDNWRTVQIAKRFPEIRFNADLSHWYNGHEMVYGDWEQKIEFIHPVLERTRFIHGRIATPGAIQAPLSGNPKSEYIQHFRQMWRLCFEGFLKTSAPGDVIIFAPELLTSSNYYAQTYHAPSGEAQEHSDRWLDALLLKKIATEEFENAKASQREHS